MKKRLIEFLAYLGIGQTKFEEKVGISRGLINNIKGDISLGTVKKIISTYPELNKDWLLTGEGDMLIKPASQPVVATSNGVLIPIEVWEIVKAQQQTINNQQQIIRSQQLTIEYLTKKGDTVDDAQIANVG
jgi:transcriptional regulator with XRE-family HTH domain